MQLWCIAGWRTLSGSSDIGETDMMTGKEKTEIETIGTARKGKGENNSAEVKEISV